MSRETSPAHVDIGVPGPSVLPEDKLVVAHCGSGSSITAATTTTTTTTPTNIKSLRGLHPTLSHPTLNFEERKCASDSESSLSLTLEQNMNNTQSQASSSDDSQPVPNGTLENAPSPSAREGSPSNSDATLYALSREVTPEPEIPEPEIQAPANEEPQDQLADDINIDPLLVEGAPTVIVEDDRDQLAKIEYAKAMGVKVRDFYYEMTRPNPLLAPACSPESQQTPSRPDFSDVKLAAKVFTPFEPYLAFRGARALHQRKNGLSRPKLSPIELVYMINIGWIKLADCDWQSACEMLGQGLLSYAQVQPEFRIRKSRWSRLPTEEDVERLINVSKPTEQTEAQSTIEPTVGEEERSDNGPFGISLLHLVDNAILEEIYKEIVRVDEEGEEAKENLDHIWSQPRTGQCAAMLFKPILDRMRKPFAPTTPLDALPTELFDFQDEAEQDVNGLRHGDQANEVSAGPGGSRGVKRTSPSEEMVKSLETHDKDPLSSPLSSPPSLPVRQSPQQDVPRPQKRRRVLDNDNSGTPSTSSTSAPAPTPAAAGSPSAIRVLRNRTYRTDAPTRGKSRPGRRKTKAVAKEPKASPSLVSSNNAPSGSDRKGKKRSREEEIDSSSMEPRKKRLAGRVDAVADETPAIPCPAAAPTVGSRDETINADNPLPAADAPTPEVRDEMNVVAVAPTGPERNVNSVHNSLDPPAIRRGAPLGLSRMRTYTNLGEPSRR